MRQLALLADRHEAGAEVMSYGAPEDESAGLDAGDAVDGRLRPGPRQLIHCQAENPCVTQQGGDVTKQNSGLGIVRYGSDGRGDLFPGAGAHPGKSTPPRAARDIAR